MEFQSICGRIGISQPKDAAPEAAEAVEGGAHSEKEWTGFQRESIPGEELGVVAAAAAPVTAVSQCAASPHSHPWQGHVEPLALGR